MSIHNLPITNPKCDKTYNDVQLRRILTVKTTNNGRMSVTLLKLNTSTTMPFVC